MSVNKPDRKLSKIDYDNIYFKMYDDAMKLIQCSFGADKDIREEYKDYISTMKEKIINDVTDTGKYIRIANSIFPVSQAELTERRLYQEKAIGLCYDLLTKYQLVMKYLKVADDKYVEEIRHIVHEINCLKSWRTSDRKRFVSLG